MVGEVSLYHMYRYFVLTLGKVVFFQSGVFHLTSVGHVVAGLWSSSFPGLFLTGSKHAERAAHYLVAQIRRCNSYLECII